MKSWKLWSGPDLPAGPQLHSWLKTLPSFSSFLWTNWTRFFFFFFSSSSSSSPPLGVLQNRTICSGSAPAWKRVFVPVHVKHPKIQAGSHFTAVYRTRRVHIWRPNPASDWTICGEAGPKVASDLILRKERKRNKQGGGGRGVRKNEGRRTKR